MAGENAWGLYEQGRINDALNLALEELLQEQTQEAQEALHAIVAWCYYRRKEFDQALAEIAIAGDNLRARECHVYVLAYSKAHTDDAKLSELVSTMSGNINAANALLIRARTRDSTVSHDQVWKMAEGFTQIGDVANHDVPLANLLHNCARFFHDRARDQRDLKFALGLIEVALAHYGDISNWHHRAAANFWMSHILEKLTAIPQAFVVAATSLRLWESQCAVEKKTAPWIQNLEQGSKRVAELAIALVAFAKRAHG